MTAVTYAHPPDLLALVAAVAVIALTAWPQLRRDRGKARHKRSGRVCARPLLTPTLQRSDDMSMLPETSPPPEASVWPSSYCPGCVDGCCDRAEHLGLTDADVPGGDA